MPIACDRSARLGKDRVSVLSMRTRHGEFDQEGKAEVPPEPTNAANLEHEQEQEGGETPPEPTGLEPATSAVTGRRSNQLS
jgi:hypothetical protein